MRYVGASISMHLMRQARFIVAGFCVSSLVLVPGAVWYQSAVASMARASADGLTSLLKARLDGEQRQLETELSLSSLNIWRVGDAVRSSGLRRDLPFDLVVAFDHERKMMDGYRLMASTNASSGISQDRIKLQVPVDSGFFDGVSDTNPISGLLMIEGKPMVIAVQRIAMTAHSSVFGFALVGRWLDVSSLGVNGTEEGSSPEIFSLGLDDKLPDSVQNAMLVAQRNNGYTFDVGSKGAGVLYLLLDDIQKRPAMLIKAPWPLPWKATGMVGFGIYYMVSVLAGVGTWMVLTANDFKNRRRTRRFDGLASLSPEHLRIFVESFPGYAFALNGDLKYLGVSRILAGVTGKEPSDFVGESFEGDSSHAANSPLVEMFDELRDPARWPPLASVEHVTDALGHQHEFSGVAHYLSRHDAVLVILAEKEGAQVVPFPETHPVGSSSNDAVA